MTCRHDNDVIAPLQPEELKQVESELKSAYGLIEPVEDVALLSRIAIEIAIGAAQTNGMRLDFDDFPLGFDAIKASENDGFMAVCLATARNVLNLLK